MKKLKRKFLITGHPRSGTGYMSALFHANGYEVHHEYMGKDGTSNWQMAVNADEYPYPLNCGDKIVRKHVEFETVIHVIREPLAVIASTMYTETDRSEKFRSEHVPIFGCPAQKATLSYYFWSNLIQKQRPDITLALPSAKEVLGFKHDTESRNSRNHPDITEQELQALIKPKSFELYLSMKLFYERLLKNPVILKTSSFRHL